MTETKISVLVGSLRKDSFSRKIAKALTKFAPGDVNFDFVEIGNLPLYNQDRDENPYQEWVEFRKRVKDSDGIVFATPEYNRSVPGVLKNAIDVGSRPYGHSVWNAKPCAVISVSPGQIGAFGANHHLRQSLVFLNMPTMPQPEAYIGGVAKLLDEKGELTSDETKQFLSTFMNAFLNWCSAFEKIPA